MAYRIARSLEKLRSQINAMAPNRSKASDGWIGDSAHFATGAASDHNPWVKQGSLGIVTALDITHDPQNGVDVMAIANAIIKSRDRRMKYMIYTGGTGGRPGIISAMVSPWTWRPRTYDDHQKHLHISVDSNVADYDSTSPWSIGGPVEPPPPPPPPPPTKVFTADDVKIMQGIHHYRPTGAWARDFDPLTVAVRGAAYGKPFDARMAQRALGVTVDGDFGPKSKLALALAVRRIQTVLGVTRDGVWGRATDSRYFQLRSQFRR